jgi:nucleoside-diphosphate-sugar epimerase
VKRILITGGGGFVARHFVERLTHDHIALTLFDLAPPDWDAGAATVVLGDVRDPAALRRAAQGCDAVLHLAAAHHDSGLSPETYYDVNERGTRTLCRVLDETGIRDVCFFSTVAVYGAAPEPRHEDTPPQPVTPYGGSKLAAERVFQEWVAAAPGRRVLVIRPPVVFGAGNFANMYSLIRQIDSGRFVRVGTGDNVKSLVYVDNLVDATLLAWRRDATGFEIVNVVDKPDLTSREIADIVFRAFGKRPPRVNIPLTLGIALGLPFDAVSLITGRRLSVSTARIRKYASDQTKFEADKLSYLGFRAGVSLEEGLRRTVAWYQHEGRAKATKARLPPARVMFSPA